MYFDSFFCDLAKKSDVIQDEEGGSCEELPKTQRIKQQKVEKGQMS